MSRNGQTHFKNLAEGKLKLQETSWVEFTIDHTVSFRYFKENESFRSNNSEALNSIRWKYIFSNISNDLT